MRSRKARHFGNRPLAAFLGSLLVAAAACAADSPKSCAQIQSCPLVVAKDPTQCLQLEAQLKDPSAFVSGGQIQLDRFEKIVGDWMGGLCYRRASNEVYDWPHDATARDTGPFITTFADGKFSGKSLGSHVVARVWYSPEMHTWMLRNRPADEERAPADPTDIPQGAIMVKEMWPAPAELYRGECFDCKPPGSSGAVIFIRDSKSFSTGWFTGWYGEGAVIDWPAGAANSLTSMGDGGQGFCMNCHGSTTPGNTFASINNISGHPATFLTQLPPMSTQAAIEATDHHRQNAIPLIKLIPIDQPRTAPSDGYSEAFGAALADANASSGQDAQRAKSGTTGTTLLTQAPPSGLPVPPNMPSQTYDSVLIPGEGPVDHFMTSTQCVGCHQANATGLQLDMLDFTPGPLGAHGGGKPVSTSPYSMWSSSPMGLAGRDPIFYSQLESEQIIHVDWDEHATPAQKAELRAVIQDTCLQCHGNMGQRQQAIDSHDESGICAKFSRAQVNAVPYPYTDANWPHVAQAASYGGLARDGISCATCHHLALDEQAEKYADAPWNACIKRKQKSLNPTFTGFAATFSGSFPLGSPETLNGPFADPLLKPMANSLRVIPEHNKAISTSEVCGSCHSIHLPVLDQPQPESRCLPQTDPPDPFRCYPKRYEQTTYPEWVFSAYRSGKLGDKPLPSGPGETPRTCQQCHMPSVDSKGDPLKSKVASIEEYSNYPQTDYRLPASEIDLPVRENYSQHQLVGLNVFLIEMAQQFPDIFGIRSQDPGLGGMNVPPLQVTENAMLIQARNHTAELSVDSHWDAKRKTLEVKVSVNNLAGHKLPSGVSFRRVFVTLEVKNAQDEVVWASGRSNDEGVIVDQLGEPVAGEFWWDQTCKARLPNAWQPHYQQITEQNQAQIYQELITDAQGRLTTSFLSINEHPKDNRLQPHGFLPEAERIAIAAALGDRTPIAPHGKSGPVPMDENLGVAVGPEGNAAKDPDYHNGSGIDQLSYVVSGLDEEPASVVAQLSYQAIPPFYQQDRFCTAVHAKGTPVVDTERLHYLTGHVDLDGTGGEGWRVVVGRAESKRR